MSQRRIIKQANKHPSLIPLFVFIGGGRMGGHRGHAVLMRLALFNPAVSWDRKNNPEAWNKMNPTDQHKSYSGNVDYSKLKKEGPEF
ncbi:cytochrome c oxidase subunit NDUFA4-like [Trichosurus vulpecula]|uniref:cytochrome c oxidase subunit NDUFA4-like n=1 Tax=Trichosurus vulpecula TaxID=9337 RepID=UPI00186AC09C|nr:cytochrome c oxidase subunit NDUFA4-like [Trichosurus vulpecula]